MTRTIIDINILQTVPPSNLNRDDTGSPKTAVYGGARRARVSSQAWKRATRLGFEERLDQTDLGMRTKRLVEEVARRARRLEGELSEEDAIRAATAVLEAAGVKLKAPRVKKGEAAGPGESEFLFFLSSSQLDRIARLAVDAERSEDPKAALKAAAPKKILAEDHSIDIALFGRMVANLTDLNVDAAAQVAHALSVHAVDEEFDYFTAVDDAKDSTAGDDAGAAMIGTVAYNSSTLYRYATVNAERLLANLGDAQATRRAIEAFVQSFAASMPSGKQNTFANRTLPDAIVVTLRDSQSVNLVGAFEEPVVGDARLRRAAEALAEHATEVDANFGTTPMKSWVVRVGAATEALDVLGERVTFPELADAVGEAVAERLMAAR
ncbi:type I-E CRISPR-associated protein Cas7/Cse4/CasC [Leucobacter allii]|uniref:type I-E CRISPR-associated protein Cas7/Cse4/CasC n=1 Tax=Leucobacter allii TaxID=2932247 RepID=UPI001FCFB6CB|nr:type I-E CRISPR-associated protein Cas7/Cse4/CasC [Leucobacter allii]UOR01727.1 type I-E CRISPR-associated protein Cas7/Cse4/CasC [Leucobacter allii]